MKFVNLLFGSRLWALVLKELNQILRNSELISLLIFPPTVQLIIFGLALNPVVENITLGILDYSNTPNSRELISAFTQNHVFKADQYNFRAPSIGQAVETGKVTAGLVIPPEFNRDLHQDGTTAQVQVLINAVDANTAGIASGYITQIVNQFSQELDPSQPKALVNPQIKYLYNPGLESAWYFVPGVLGVVVTLISSLASATTVVREKDLGTLEQLLMTPAAGWEILFAKLVPLWVLLMGDSLLALGVGHIVFGVPVQRFGLFLVLTSLFVTVGIALGILMATFSRNQQQAQLVSFFVTQPMIQLSGAISPTESLPIAFQYLSQLNPLYHYVVILRGLLLKDVGLGVLWPHALTLLIFAVVLLTISIQKFRTQVS